jgi:2-polyprenyl-3-methyl-5-hydroxy-6-metoxy-1,4-benzoquinol methylase
MLPRLFTLLAANAVGAVHNARHPVRHHLDLEFGHVRGLVSLMINMSDIHTALDVGCAHGLAVELLWGWGVQANGVDISAAAIDSATKTWLPDGVQYAGCCVFDPCFLVSSVTDLSAYHNGSFDAILSTNVLDHLKREEIDLAIAELCRVSSRYIFIHVRSGRKSPSMFSTPKGRSHPARFPMHVWTAKCRANGFWPVRRNGVTYYAKP